MNELYGALSSYRWALNTEAVQNCLVQEPRNNYLVFFNTVHFGCTPYFTRSQSFLHGPSQPFSCELVMRWIVYFAVCKLFRAWSQFINFNLQPTHKSTGGTGHWEVALTNAGGWLIHCPGFNVSKFLSNRTASDDHIPHLGRLEYFVVQGTLKIDYGLGGVFLCVGGGRNKMAKNKLSKTDLVPLHCVLLTVPLISLLAFLRNRAIIFFPSDLLLLLRLMSFPCSLIPIEPTVFCHIIWEVHA